MKIVHDRTNREGRRIKKKVEVLRDKFTKIFAAKTKDMIEKMMKLVNKNVDESEKQIWDNFYSLMSEFEKIELEQHPRYMLGIMMIVGMKNKDKITDGQKQRFVEIIETNDI